jgi:hypothetical protein
LLTSIILPPEPSFHYVLRGLERSEDVGDFTLMVGRYLDIQLQTGGCDTVLSSLFGIHARLSAKKV